MKDGFKVEGLNIKVEKYTEEIKKEVGKATSEMLVERVWKQDYTVWNPRPDEISNRLGWLDIAERMQAEVSATRSTLQQYPMIAALKATIAHYSRDPGWATLRPPLVELTPEQAGALTRALGSRGFAMPSLGTSLARVEQHDAVSAARNLPGAGRFSARQVPAPATAGRRGPRGLAAVHTARQRLRGLRRPRSR